LFTEARSFPIDPAFAAQANVSDAVVYETAEADPEAFWAGFARELDWFKPFERVLDWQPPHARWFEGGKINVAYNCLDRHLSPNLSCVHRRKNRKVRSASP